MAKSPFFSSFKYISKAAEILSFKNPLTTWVSMAISLFCYMLLFGTWVGIGITVMLFIHEMGHIAAFNLKKIKVSGPLFLPLLGAVINSPVPHDRDGEAFVGYGGPLLGTIGALLCLAVWPFTSGEVAEALLVAGYIGVFLNLFNLIPLSPMDGGRIAQVLTDKCKYVGVAILYAVAVTLNPIIFLVWIFFLAQYENMDLWMRPILATILAVTFGALMLSGGPPYNTITLISVFVAVGCAALFWIRDAERQRVGAKAAEVEERPYPPMKRRLLWIALYGGLIGITGVTFVLMHMTGNVPGFVK